MVRMNHTKLSGEKPELSPLSLQSTWDGASWLVVHIDTSCADLRNPSPKLLWAVHQAMLEAFSMLGVHPAGKRGLLKVHIGEPNCITRMRPEYTKASALFLREMGTSAVVCGDTTVAYTGPRGHKENPSSDVSSYMELARRHGWSADGPAGAPFVVLDRPSTQLPGQFEFAEEEVRHEVSGINQYRDFYMSGGFAAADFVFNHAHLTLHGLAGLAGCVKSLAMGCSSLKGKLRMHMSLLPFFDPDLCTGCGQCIEHCPENALTLSEAHSAPEVDPNLCIGCGECQAVCINQAVRIEEKDVRDWQRGKGTFSSRIVDYTMGLMHGRWQRTVHVLHMYSITRLCDCVNTRQEPIVTSDLGFLVGRNPFAVDLVSSQTLTRALREEGSTDFRPLIRSAETSAEYSEKNYGIPIQAEIRRISCKDFSPAPSGGHWVRE